MGYEEQTKPRPPSANQERGSDNTAEQAGIAAKSASKSGTEGRLDHEPLLPDTSNGVQSSTPSSQPNGLAKAQQSPSERLGNISPGNGVPDEDGPTLDEGRTTAPSDSRPTDQNPHSPKVNGTASSRETTPGAPLQSERASSLEVEIDSASAASTAQKESCELQPQVLGTEAPEAASTGALSSHSSEDGSAKVQSTLQGRQQVIMQAKEPSESGSEQQPENFDTVILDNSSDQSVNAQDVPAGEAASPAAVTAGFRQTGSIASSAARNLPDVTRLGVTASPPRSPKQEPKPPSTSKVDAGSLADDLAEAEAQAEVAALAASQRNSSLGKKSVEEQASLEEDLAPFTEEALQSDEKEATPPQARPAPARPFSPPPGAAAKRSFEGRTGEESFEPSEFRGLVFHDGVDAMGRPVIVMNADAVSPKVSRKAACAYMLQRLEPIVTQGPYVLVLLNMGRSSRSNKLSPGWLASSYREMSYPFKKNVKHVILVRPSATLNLMLYLMRPLLSTKSYVKLKKVDNLSAIAEATNSEVTLQHLGPRFAASAGQAIVADESLGRIGLGAYQMPDFRS